MQVRARKGARCSHDPWTEHDRRMLRELAAIHKSDWVIARLLPRLPDGRFRTPHAIAWQRRKLRIQLCPFLPHMQRIAMARMVRLKPAKKKLTRAERFEEVRKLVARRIA